MVIKATSSGSLNRIRETKECPWEQSKSNLTNKSSGTAQFSKCPSRQATQDIGQSPILHLILPQDLSSRYRYRADRNLNPAKMTRSTISYLISSKTRSTVRPNKKLRKNTSHSSPPILSTKTSSPYLWSKRYQSIKAIYSSRLPLLPRIFRSRVYPSESRRVTRISRPSSPNNHRHSFPAQLSLSKQSIATTAAKRFSLMNSTRSSEIQAQASPSSFTIAVQLQAISSNLPK